MQSEHHILDAATLEKAKVEVRAEYKEGGAEAAYRKLCHEVADISQAQELKKGEVASLTYALCHSIDPVAAFKIEMQFLKNHFGEFAAPGGTSISKESISKSLSAAAFLNLLENGQEFRAAMLADNIDGKKRNFDEKIWHRIAGLSGDSETIEISDLNLAQSMDNRREFTRSHTDLAREAADYMSKHPEASHKKSGHLFIDDINSALENPKLSKSEHEGLQYMKDNYKRLSAYDTHLGGWKIAGDGGITLHDLEID